MTLPDDAHDVFVQDVEVDAIWPVARYEETRAAAFPVDLAHRDAPCAAGLAADWARVWRRANACPRDPRVDGVAAFVAPRDVAKDSRWLRDALPPTTTLVLLAAPDAWDPAFASPSWAQVLAKFDPALRAALSARVRGVAAALRDELADAPNTVVVDRTAVLRRGDVQEHTHLSRRAQVLVAEATLAGLPP